MEQITEMVKRGIEMKAEGIEETGTTEEEMTNALVRARSHLKLMVCYISLIILAIFTFFIIIIVSYIHIFYLFSSLVYNAFSSL